MPAMPAPSLVANAVETGGMTMVYGSGFPEGEEVTLTASGVILASAAANADNAFMVEAEVTLDPGVYTLVATHASGPGVTATLLVVEEK
jgi:hypothetical protein